MATGKKVQPGRVEEVARHNQLEGVKRTESGADLLLYEADLKRRDGETLAAFVIRYKALYQALGAFHNSDSLKRHRQFLDKAKQGGMDMAINASSSS